MYFFPKTLRVKLKCFWHLGYWINLKSPKTFNEKIAKRKLNDIDSRFVTCADKLAVRDYVKEKIGVTNLIPLLYSGNSITDEILAKLGSNFVAKNNHDSGNVFIVKEDSNYDFLEIADKLNESLKFDFGKRSDELWYSHIKPKILVEKLLINRDGSQPIDYKFHFFNGDEPTIILQVDYDRFTNHSRSFYDMEGALLPFSIKLPRLNRKLDVSIVCLHEMRELCIKLGGDFDYVRVDFYLVDEQVYFGEMTFAHESGFGKFEPFEYDKKLGALWG